MRVDPVHAVAVMINHGLQPLVAFPGSNAPWPVVCLTCGYEGSAPSYNDVNRGASGGCWSCRSNKISAALMRDATEAYQIMMDGGWHPLEPYPGAGKLWLSECRTCGTRYTKRLSHVQDKTGGCRKCLGLDWTDAEARRVMEGVGLIPLKDIPYPGSQKHWPSTCVVCNEVQMKTVFSKIRYRGHVCGTCRGRKIAVSLRLSAVKAVALMQAKNWQPLEDYPGSVDRPWHALCLDCGVESHPRLHNMNGDRRSCSRCAQRGIDYSQPGQVYLVYGPRWLKVGIATGRDRIDQHVRGGWFVDSTWHVPTAREARAIEQAVLAYARAQGYVHMPAEEQMERRGYTETAPLELLGWARAAIEAQIVGEPLPRLATVGPPVPMHPKWPRTRRNS